VTEQIREALADADEVLLRQVHPSFLRDGRPSSQEWKPTKKDEGWLSVARDSLTSAQAAFEHHTQQRRLASAGTWAVTVGECQTEDLGAYSDPLNATSTIGEDSAHAVIDFTGLPNSQVEAKAVRLSRCASERGCLYAAPGG
jgi:hypothetical protein